MRFDENAMNWIGATVGDLVGTVGAILSLKDTKVAIPFTFAADNSSFEKSLFVPGLQNLQNNCFLNVVLQALASCFCFQSFLHGVIGECGSKDLDENMPLALALATLLEELSSVSAERVTLSPRKMMLAMSNNIPNFNLTSQQDAAEAFLHLLCLLREEFGGCYAPKMSSLADIFASNNRILTPIQRDCQSEQERWQQLFLGPFDGILGSRLTCQSCSSLISINFEHFDCLPLSPVLSDTSSMVELKMIRRCSDPEICNCRKMYNLDKLPWSNRFSHTLKQLSIARCPRILCIQLKRVYMNVFGELVKLQGHISFPLILDVLSFMTTRLGVKTQDIDVQSLPLNLKYNRRNFFPNHSDLQSEISTLKFSGLYGATREQINSDGVIDDGFVSSTNGQALHSDTVFPCSGSSESIHSDTHMQSIDQVDVSCNLVPQETCLYQLVSVVEHFGKAGSGHYTVYRSVRVESSEDVSDDYLNQTPMRWFCISDSQVHAVSVEGVLSSEASLLFYERIPRN
ncbi:ubiquitin carboxyl-terminal hydrolase 27 isoform X3 [Glycine max]|uniref:ubiquitin carboxyl-terminal hydrolase 27 isoform X3 n=1 Tax=Glycine max TaxID=3847 RepID=UPI0007191585|nr:ubiquitin carboxyl-terminal hydrolase 27 isoform X3 [Glycine max]|eukprot:XP_014631266.1 ubiquitin carboxyl-terminal hydrolase 27-like isoform X3 [Glycine max]